MPFDANMENAGAENFQATKQELAAYNVPPEGGKATLSNALAGRGLAGGFGGPEGEFAPVGRIVVEEERQPFPIGGNRVMQAAFAGQLDVRINDDNARDNRGLLSSVE
jgi:hypothetical protein